LRFQIG